MHVEGLHHAPKSRGAKASDAGDPALRRSQETGSDEAEILEDVKAIPSPARGWLSERMRDAGFYYFIGSVLRTREPERAYTYFMQALACWPLYPRAWLGLLRLIKTPRQNEAAARGLMR